MNKITPRNLANTEKRNRCDIATLYKLLILLFVFLATDTVKAKGSGLFPVAAAVTTISDINCSNNGTFENAADDFVLFQLTPGTTFNYAVTATFGGNPVAITTMDNAAPTNVFGGVPTYFKIPNGTLGAGNFTITITPTTGSPEVLTFANTGTCATACTITSSGNKITHYFYSPYRITELAQSGTIPQFDEGSNRGLASVKIDYGVTFFGDIRLNVSDPAGINYNFRERSNLAFNIAGTAYSNTLNVVQNPGYPGTNAYPTGVTTIPFNTTYSNNLY